MKSKQWIVISVFVLVLTLSLNSALVQINSDPSSGKVINLEPPETPTINNNTVNVNNSEYLQGFVPADFWQSYNDQTGLTGNKSGSFNLTTTGYICDGSGICLSSLIDGMQNSSAWNRTSGNVFLNHPADKVGIGTDTPSGILHIIQTSTTGNTLYVYRDLASVSTDSAVTVIQQDNTLDDQPPLTLYNDGVGDTLRLVEDGSDILNVHAGGNLAVVQNVSANKINSNYISTNEINATAINSTVTVTQNMTVGNFLFYENADGHLIITGI